MGQVNHAWTNPRFILAGPTRNPILDLKILSIFLKWNTFASWIFLNTNMNCTRSNHWLHQQRNIIVAYRTSNHSLDFEFGQWKTIPISRDTRLCCFWSYNAVENEAHFVQECPLYKTVRDKYPSLFENVVLGSLESFFQLDHQVDINLYIPKVIALCHP